MRVLVTGAAGFIGSHVVDALVASGCEVVGVDALLPLAHAGPPDYLNAAVEYHWLDLTDEEALAPAAGALDAVCHHASMVGLGKDFSDARAYVYNNDLGTATLLKVLAGNGFHGRLVLASSMVVYGEGSYSCAEHGAIRPPPRKSIDLAAGRFDPACPACGRTLAPAAVTEAAPTDPRNVYAATKLHQEHLCECFGRELGAPTTMLRYHNVYGPRMPDSSPYAGVASIFRSALAHRRGPRVFEDGRQLRDFVHVGDVARANLAALGSPEGVTGPFNVASGRMASIGEMAGLLARYSSPGAPSPSITGEFRLGDVRHVFASPERARGHLGWSAEVTLEQGMKDFAEAALR